MIHTLLTSVSFKGHASLVSGNLLTNSLSGGKIKLPMYTHADKETPAISPTKAP